MPLFKEDSFTIQATNSSASSIDIDSTSGGIQFNVGAGKLVDFPVVGTLAIAGAACTSSASEFNVLTGVTGGTAVADKAVVLDSSKDITGINNVTIDGNLTLTGGDLTVTGTTTTINSTDLIVDDKLIVIGSGNGADTLNLGLLMEYTSSGTKWAGIVRDKTTKRLRLVKNITTADDDLTGAQTADFTVKNTYVEGNTYATSAHIITSSGSGNDALLLEASNSTNGQLHLRSAGNVTDAVHIEAVNGGITLKTATEGLAFSTGPYVFSGTSASSLSSTGGLTLAATTSNLALNSNAGKIVLTSTDTNGDAISLDANTGAGGVRIAGTTATAVDLRYGTASQLLVTGDGTMDLRNLGSMTINHSTDDTGQDFTIQKAGADASDLIITTNGTSSTALQLTASAGDMQITHGAAKKIYLGASSSTISHAAAGDAQNLTIEQTGGNNAKLILQSDGTGAEAVKITSSGVAGGITMSAGTSGLVYSGGPTDLNATGTTQVRGSGTVTISSTANATDAIQLTTATGTSETIKILNTLGQGVSDTDAAIQLTATAGQLVVRSDLVNTSAVKILGGTSGAGIVLTTTGTSDVVDITRHTGANPGFALGGVNVTATAAELNLLDGVTATTNEINYLDITTMGTIVASGLMHVDSSNNFTSSTAMTMQNSATGGAALTLHASGGTTGTLDLVSDGTGTDAIFLNATAGGVDINAVKDVAIDTAGDINLTSTNNSADAIYIKTNGGTTDTIKIHNVQGNTENAITIQTDQGVINLDGCNGVDIKYQGTTQADFGANGTLTLKTGVYNINHTASLSTDDLTISHLGGNGSFFLKSDSYQSDALTLSTTSGGNIRLTTNGAGGEVDCVANFNMTGNIDMQNGNIDGATDVNTKNVKARTTDGLLLESTYNVNPSILVKTNGGAGEKLKINSVQGTGNAAIEIVSDAGGVTLTAAAGKNVILDGHTWPNDTSWTAGSALTTNGSGTLSWKTISQYSGTVGTNGDYSDVRAAVTALASGGSPIFLYIIDDVAESSSSINCSVPLNIVIGPEVIWDTPASGYINMTNNDPIRVIGTGPVIFKEYASKAAAFATGVSVLRITGSYFSQACEIEMRDLCVTSDTGGNVRITNYGDTFHWENILVIGEATGDFNPEFYFARTAPTDNVTTVKNVYARNLNGATGWVGLRFMHNSTARTIRNLHMQNVWTETITLDTTTNGVIDSCIFDNVNTYRDSTSVAFSIVSTTFTNTQFKNSISLKAFQAVLVGTSVVDNISFENCFISQRSAGIAGIDFTFYAAGATIDRICVTNCRTDDANMFDFNGGTNLIDSATAWVVTNNIGRSAGSTFDFPNDTALNSVTLDDFVVLGNTNISFTGTIPTVFLNTNQGTGEVIQLRSVQSTQANSIELLSDAGAIRLDGATGVDMQYNSVSQANFSADGTLTLKANSAYTITHAADGSGDHLTISQTGAQAASLILSSAGTGADAINIDATGGGIDVDASSNITLDSQSGAIALTGFNGVSLNAQNTSIVDIDSGIGGITIDTLGSFAMSSGTSGMQLVDSVGGETLVLDYGFLQFGRNNVATVATHTADSTSDDLTIKQAGAYDASLILTSEGTGTDAVLISATAGGIQLTTTGASDVVDITRHTGTNPGFALGGVNVSATAAELNLLDGVTATTNELNYLDIGALGTIEASGLMHVDAGNNFTSSTSMTMQNSATGGAALKLHTSGGTTGTLDLVSDGTGTDAILLDATAGGIQLTTTNVSNVVDITRHDGTNPGFALGGVNVTATAAELNLLDGVTATTNELNYLDITTLGTIVASGLMHVDSNNNFTSSTAMTMQNSATGGAALTLHASGGTTGTLDIFGDGTGINAITIAATAGGIQLSTTNVSSVVDITRHTGTNPGFALGGVNVTATAAELNYLDITTLGTVIPSGLIHVDSNNDFTSSTAMTMQNSATGGAALKLHASGGTTGTLDLVSDGTGTDAILLDATAGGIQLTTTDTSKVVDITRHTGANPGFALGGVNVTATAAELNLLDGVTATTNELNYLDIGALGTVEASGLVHVDSSNNFTSSTSMTMQNSSTGGVALKLHASGGTTGTLDLVSDGTGADAILLDATAGGIQLTTTDTSKVIDITRHDGTNPGFALGGVNVSATAAELNLLDGVTATTNELNYLDITTMGTIVASGLMHVDASNNFTSSTAMTMQNSATGGSALTLHASGGTTGTLDLLSDGTGINAITIDATAGGIQLTTTDTSKVVDITRHTGANPGFALGGVNVSATAAELNLLDGVTATTNELNYLDITTLGTIVASGLMHVDSSNNFTSSTSMTMQNSSTGGVALKLHANGGTTGTLDLVSDGTGADAILLDASSGGIQLTTTNISNVVDITRHTGTNPGFALGGVSVTATAAELNYLDITTLGTVTPSGLMHVDASNDFTSSTAMTMQNSATGGAALTLHASGGTTGTLDLVSDGTGADAILINASAGGITLSAAAGEKVYIDGHAWPNDTSWTLGHVLKTNASGVLSWGAASSQFTATVGSSGDYSDVRAAITALAGGGSSLFLLIKDNVTESSTSISCSVPLIIVIANDVIWDAPSAGSITMTNNDPIRIYGIGPVTMKQHASKAAAFATGVSVLRINHTTFSQDGEVTMENLCVTSGSGGNVIITNYGDTFYWNNILCIGEATGDFNVEFSLGRSPSTNPCMYMNNVYCRNISGATGWTGIRIFHDTNVRTIENMRLSNVWTESISINPNTAGGTLTNSLFDNVNTYRDDTAQAFDITTTNLTDVQIINSASIKAMGINMYGTSTIDNLAIKNCFISQQDAGTAGIHISIIDPLATVDRITIQNCSTDDANMFDFSGGTNRVDSAKGWIVTNNVGRNAGSTFDFPSDTALNSVTLDNFVVLGNTNISFTGTISTVYFNTNQGTDEVIQIHSVQSTQANSIELLSDAGAIRLDGATGVDMQYNSVSQANFSADGTLTLKANSAYTITHAADSSADDLTISQTGAQDASLLLTSAGTGADAIGLTSSAGGITLDTVAASKDIALTSALGSVVLSSGEAVADAVELVATNSSGGIKITPGSGAKIDLDGVQWPNDTSHTEQNILVTNTSGVLSWKPKLNRTTVTSGTPYTPVVTDDIIGCNFAGAVTINLPAANTEGMVAITIKDESGAAATNNITINRDGSDLIDGQTSYVINSNYEAVSIYSDGTSKWFIY